MQGFVYIVFSKFNFKIMLTPSELLPQCSECTEVGVKPFLPLRFQLQFDLSLLLHLTGEKGFSLDLQQAIP